MWFRKSKKSTITNKLDTGSKISGDIHSDGSWQIAGTLHGNLIVTEDIQIEPEAEIVGNITGDNIRIAGKVEGKIHAVNRLFLLSSCTITGDISYGILELEEGASIAGMSLSGITLQEMESTIAAPDAVPVVEEKQAVSKTNRVFIG